ncbi:DNA helicase [Tanacetum coccineum]
MSHDIPRRVSETTHIPNYHLNDDSLQGYILYEIEIILNNYGKLLQHLGLGPPPLRLLDMLANKLIIEERNYNQEELQQQKVESVPRLNSPHRKIYDLIIGANATNQQDLIFVYRHGGTGKTFLWKIIISTLRSERKFVLVVASSDYYSEDQYAVSIKEDTTYPCLHSQKTTEGMKINTSYLEDSIRRIQDMESI